MGSCDAVHTGDGLRLGLTPLTSGTRVTEVIEPLRCNRLRMQRDFAQHPEIADIQIQNLTFVYGQLRSGTTKIQKLLAASGDFHHLPFRQTYHPSLITGSMTESPQPRIEIAPLSSVGHGETQEWRGLKC